MGRSASDFFSPSFRETSPPPPRQVIGCRSQAGRHTPGIFTNPSQKAHEEPRLIIVTDPLIDHQVSARGGGEEEAYLGGAKADHRDGPAHRPSGAYLGRMRRGPVLRKVEGQTLHTRSSSARCLGRVRRGAKRATPPHCFLLILLCRLTACAKGHPMWASLGLLEGISA